MDRRTAIRNISLGLGGVASTPVLLSLLASSTANAATWKAESFSVELQHIVTRLVDVILPGSSIPGALDVNVPQFIDKLYGHLFSEIDQRYFSDGAMVFAGKFEQVFKRPAMDGGREEFQQLLKGYFDLTEREQDRIFAQQDKNLADIEADDKDIYVIYKFLLSVRENTLFGYFTSERVGKEVLNYDPIPETYDGCVPLADIGNAWT